VRRAGIVAFIAAFLLPLSLPPVTAGTGTARRVVAMYSDPGDWVGGGQARLFHNGNASISVSGNAYYLTVGFSGGTLGDSFSADFAAAPGRKLHRGFYANAQRAPFRETGHPGIDISGDGRGCNTIDGSFDVKDIATGPAGGIKHLWITFEQHCEGGIAALFGEIRIGVDDRSSPATLPWVLRWPDTYPGAHGTPSPHRAARASRAVRDRRKRWHRGPPRRTVRDPRRRLQWQEGGRRPELPRLGPFQSRERWAEVRRPRLPPRVGGEAHGEAGGIRDSRYDRR
jgi:hypothetical protein